MFVGIDVQVKRPCAVVVLNTNGHPAGQGWFKEPNEINAFLTTSVNAKIEGIGVDSPRMPLAKPRDWAWRGRWRRRAPGDRGYGRHCEIILKAARLANPQWTPLAPNAPPWMKLGFEIFDKLGETWPVHEVFPSASYRQVERSGATITLDLKRFADGPKDMLDAYVAAWTVREYLSGAGGAVGGGDGLGSIILPRPFECNNQPLNAWPG